MWLACSRFLPCTLTAPERRFSELKLDYTPLAKVPKPSIRTRESNREEWCPPETLLVRFRQTRTLPRVAGMGEF
jgi:hypothetical protein